MADDLRAAAQLDLTKVTQHLVGAMAADPERGLANATAYLEVTSRVVFAMLWLRQATISTRALAAGATGSNIKLYEGKRQAARFYFGFELPRTGPDVGRSCSQRRSGARHAGRLVLSEWCASSAGMRDTRAMSSA